MGIIIFFYYAINLFLLGISIVLLTINYKKNMLTFYMPIIGVLVCGLLYFYLYTVFTTNKSTYAFEPWFKFPTYFVFYPAVLGIVLNFFKKYNYLSFCANTLLFTAIIGTIMIIVFQKYTFTILETLKLPKYY